MRLIADDQIMAINNSSATDPFACKLVPFPVEELPESNLSPQVRGRPLSVTHPAHNLYSSRCNRLNVFLERVNGNHVMMTRLRCKNVCLRFRKKSIVYISHILNIILIRFDTFGLLLTVLNHVN